MKQYSAFTIEADNGILREIKTDVGVSIADEIKKDFNLNKKILTKEAIWDTGATTSVISEAIAKELNLIPIDQTIVKTVNIVGRPPCIANVYFVDLYLPNNVRIPNIRVTGANEIGGCDCLVGMDIIAHGDFCITCLDNKRTCVSFRIPASGNKIDFVEQYKETKGDQANERKKFRTPNSAGGSKRKKSRRSR